MMFALTSLAIFVVSVFGNEVTDSGLLVKRDPSAVRATRAFQNCVVRDKNYHAKHKGGESFCNQRIQMAECYVNARVMNQVFATFVPDTGGMFDGEGGAYGECCAYNIYPTEQEIGEIANPNHACFTWETPDKKQGSGPPTMPNTVMIPYPVVCPSNLKICYSQWWFFDDKSKMASSETLVPTFTGVWGSTKANFTDGKNHYLWCHHRCGGCSMGDWQQMQKGAVADLKCDFSKCKKYKGNTQSRFQLPILPIGHHPALGKDVCKDYTSSDPVEGGPSLLVSGGLQIYKGKGSESGHEGYGPPTGSGTVISGGSSSGGSSSGGSSSGGSSGGSGAGSSSGSGKESKGAGGSSGSVSNNGSKGGNSNGGHTGGHSGGVGKGGQEDHCTHTKKRGQKQHKHKYNHKCGGGGGNNSSQKSTSTVPTKRDDSFFSAIRRHHIKEQRRNAIF